MNAKTAKSKIYLLAADMFYASNKGKVSENEVVRFVYAAMMFLTRIVQRRGADLDYEIRTELIKWERETRGVLSYGGSGQVSVDAREKVKDVMRVAAL